MKRYLLFETELQPADAASRLTELSGQQVSGRYNDDWGYYFATMGDRMPELRVIENTPDPDRYLPEPQFAEGAVLVYVEEPTPELERALDGEEWLRLVRAREL